RAPLPGALAALLRVVHGLEPVLHGPLTLLHVERALATSAEDVEQARAAASTLCFALADASPAKQLGLDARRLLGVAVDPPKAAATALFRRGSTPQAGRDRMQGFVLQLAGGPGPPAPPLAPP